MPEIPLGNVVGPHFTPSVSTDGNLSWTNNGDLPNPATVNVKGPKGDTGTFSPEDLQRISALESGKVDKVSGKSLSTNDYTDADKNAVATIGDKVDKVSGKGLSTNDYTDADKAKVDAALTQHQDISGKVDKVSGKGLSTNDYTTADKNKLSGIPADANHTTIDTTLTNAGQAADAKATGDSLSALESENALLRELINGIDADIYRTTSGSPATFADAKAANVKALSVTLTPTQSGSGNPSPSNIRPISGVSSVTVARVGKNLFDPSFLLEADNWTVDGGGVYSGQASKLYDLYHFSVGGYPVFTSFKSNTQYTFSADIICLPNTAVIRFFYTDNTTSDNIAEQGASSLTYMSGTSAPGKTVKCLYFSYSNNTALSMRNIQLEEGVTPTVFEPYAEHVTVTFPATPGTVYGGTLDVTTGTLTVTQRFIQFDGTENWGIWTDTSADYALFYMPLTPTPKVVTGGVINSHGYTCDTRNYQIRFLGLSYAQYSTVDSWKALLAAQAQNATPVQVVYELATPVTYQLTPQQLTTLGGYNAVSADAGSVSVTYKADASIIFGGG